MPKKPSTKQAKTHAENQKNYVRRQRQDGQERVCRWMPVAKIPDFERWFKSFKAGW